MIDYDDELLERIKDAASCFLTISEIAHLCMIDGDELRTDIITTGTLAHRYYYAGKTQSILEIRKQEIELATAGSPTSVDKAIEFLKSMDDDENL